MVTLHCRGCPESATRRAIEQSTNWPAQVPLTIANEQYGATELEAATNQLVVELQQAGIEGVGAEVDVAHNSVRLIVPRGIDVMEVAARQSMPVAISRINGEGAGPEIDKRTAFGYALVEGGQVIYQENVPAAKCTSGFAVQSGYGPFILTAGHCANFFPQPTCVGSLGTYVKQGGSRLGTWAACNFQGTYDAALITTYGYRNNWGRIHNTYTDDAHPITFAVTNNYLVGQTLCQTGFATTGFDGNSNIYGRCGIVDSMTASPPYVGDNGQQLSSNFLRIDYMHAEGDSGAGVVWPTGYGFGAAGIHSGSDGVGGRGLASRFSTIAAHWGLTLTPYNL